MGAIPGDDDYGKEAIASYAGELTDRLDGAESLMLSLQRNVTAIAEVVTTLGLMDDVGVQAEMSAVVETSSRILDITSNVFELLLELSGVAVNPQPKPADSPPVARPEISLATDLLPASLLEGKSPEKVRELLGQRVYGLSQKEAEAHPELIANAKSVVAVSANGRTLNVIEGKGLTHTTDDLPQSVVRCKNIYSRLLIADTREFKKSDVNDIFGPIGGFANMAATVGNTNHTLATELHIPHLFTNNGQPRAAARYILTGQVVFLD